MKMICEFCGVRTSSFGLVMRDLLKLVPRLKVPVALKFAFDDAARTSPRWVIRLPLQRHHSRRDAANPRGSAQRPPGRGIKICRASGYIPLGQGWCAAAATCTNAVTLADRYDGKLSSSSAGVSSVTLDGRDGILLWDRAFGMAGRRHQTRFETADATMSLEKRDAKTARCTRRAETFGADELARSHRQGN